MKINWLNAMLAIILGLTAGICVVALDWSIWTSTVIGLVLGIFTVRDFPIFRIED